MSRKRDPDEFARFRPKFSVAGDNECWRWTAACDSHGYGVFRSLGKSIGAHKFAHEHSTGTKVPQGMLVMHSCDNPRCVNPRHLSVGTYRDNIVDSITKGRFIVPPSIGSGERHPHAVLTNALVRDIRRLDASGFSRREIAARLGVSSGNVGGVLTGRVWRSV